MDVDYKSDRAGLKALLKSGEMAALVDPKARQIAANVDNQLSRGEEVPVVVDEYTTDRRAASVTLAHAAGLAMQAKYGTLTRAASAAGLEVKSR